MNEHINDFILSNDLKQIANEKFEDFIEAYYRIYSKHVSNNIVEFLLADPIKNTTTQRFLTVETFKMRYFEAHNMFLNNHKQLIVLDGYDERKSKA